MRSFHLQIARIISAFYEATDRISRASEISTFEKSTMGGHTFRADFP